MSDSRIRYRETFLRWLFSLYQTVSDGACDQSRHALGRRGGAARSSAETAPVSAADTAPAAATAAAASVAATVGAVGVAAAAANVLLTLLLSCRFCYYCCLLLGRSQQYTVTVFFQVPYYNISPDKTIS